MERQLGMIPPRAYIRVLEARNIRRSYKNTMNCMRKRSMEWIGEDSWDIRELHYE